MAGRRKQYRDYYPSYFSQSPKKPRGGIKAQTKRGSMGKTWWGRRWIESLEAFTHGARLSRGRSYARRGQVISIEIGKGIVEATVQGTRKRPYGVKIKVKTLSDAAWERMAEALSGRALYAARLMAGEMPEEIEEVFRKLGYSLFPSRRDDLMTGCSCPDWANPCKHVAAVYYLLAEEFDRDPFLIFRLRGMEREDFLSLLGAEKSIGKRRVRAKPEQKQGQKDEPIAVDPETFWGKDKTAKEDTPRARTPELTATLPRRLGPVSFWRGNEPFLKAMEEIYRRASSRGMDVYLGESAADE